MLTLANLVALIPLIVVGATAVTVMLGVAGSGTMAPRRWFRPLGWYWLWPACLWPPQHCHRRH